MILYAPNPGSAIWRVNPDGSGAAAVTDITINPQVDETNRYPVFLPDGNHFIYWSGNFGNKKDDRFSGIYLGSLDKKGKKLLVLCRSNGGMASKRLFYTDDEHQLVSVAFDPSTGLVSGSPQALANTVGFQPGTYWAEFTVSASDTVVYNARTGGSLSALVWMDRTGKQAGTIGEPAVMCNPAISPDGLRVAVDITDEKENNVDIWFEHRQSRKHAIHIRSARRDERRMVARRTNRRLPLEPHSWHRVARPAFQRTCPCENARALSRNGRHHSEFLVSRRFAGSCALTARHPATF